MTRAEVAQMFYNLLLDQDVEITKTFDDVPANAWYAKAVNTLASLDIISGVGDNKFEPERSITRVEFTAMAYDPGRGVWLNRRRRSAGSERPAFLTLLSC